MVVAAALGLGACGGQTGALSVAGAAALLPQVEAVENAVAAGDHEAARRQLDALRAAVQARYEAGELAPGAARDVLDAAARVEAELAPPVPATVAPVAPAPAPAPTRPVPVTRGGDGDNDDDDKGKAKGKDREKDDD